MLTDITATRWPASIISLGKAARSGKIPKAGSKLHKAAELHKLNSAYIMMYFSALESRGLKVLPTHRVINNLPDAKLYSLKQALAKHFIIEDFTNYADLSRKLKSAKITEHFFGLYLGNKIFIYSN